MKVKYKLKATATCPVDRTTVDEYDVTITARRTLVVEDILGEIKAICIGPIFQENFTSRLAITLDAKVKTVGVHSGVVTKVVCEA